MLKASARRGFSVVLCLFLAAAPLRAWAGEGPPDLIVEFCGEANEPIPDLGTLPAEHGITAPNLGAIHDLDIGLLVTHPWVGDLVVSLTHIETGTSLILIDRPGVPAVANGCASNDLSVMLDDEGAGGAMEDVCGAGDGDAVPTSPPGYVPTQALAGVDGENIGGLWVIRVLDARAENVGTLVSWCLRANLGPAGIRAGVSAEVNGNPGDCATGGSEMLVAPGSVVRVCYRVENIGGVSCGGHVLSTSLHGELLSGDPTVLAPGEAHYVTALSLISEDVLIEGAWTAFVGDSALQSQAALQIRIDSDDDGQPDKDDKCPGFDDLADADGDGTADGCDGCPDDPVKTDPGACGCGVSEDSCGQGNENSNENENGNTNTNENDNSNTNENENGNQNENQNENANENENSNTNENANENENSNTNENGNTNENENSNSNENGNENANANENSNENLNENSNVNANDNIGNDNQNEQNQNINSNDNVANNQGPDNSNKNAADSDSNDNSNQNAGNGNDNSDDDIPSLEDCFIECGAGLCGTGGASASILSLMGLSFLRRRLNRR